jgi:hypothetical protein
MDINETRHAVGTLRSVDILTASPRVVAESFSQATALHRSLSETQAANAGLAWDCGQLHEELTGIEKKWTESIQAIREENSRLRADREKLVLVAETITKTARLYRTQLAETVQKRNATAKLYETVAQRGRGWQSVAVKRGQKVAELEHQVLVSCTAIDMLAEQLVNAESGENRKTVVGIALANLAEMYHVDTAKLARTIATLRYPTEVAKPEIKEKLAAAKTWAQVLTLITEWDKSAAPVTPAAIAPSSAEITPAAAKPAATVQEGITAVRVEQLGHQLSFEQAVGIARRLSPVQK